MILIMIINILINDNSWAKSKHLYIFSIAPEESWRPLIRVAPCFWLKYEGVALFIYRPVSIMLVDSSTEGESAHDVYSVAITNAIMNPHDGDKRVDDSFSKSHTF